LLVYLMRVMLLLLWLLLWLPTKASQPQGDRQLCCVLTLLWIARGYGA